MRMTWLARCALAFLVSVGLYGCASAPSTTTYQISTNVPDVDIYKGSDPSSMNFYTKAPYFDVASASKGWSNQYFKAVKAGYFDSPVILQPMGAWGIPQRIHFEMQPQAVGTAEEFAPYAARNSIAACEEFLVVFPRAPIRGDVLGRMVALLEGQKDRESQLTRLAEKHPGLIEALPLAERLLWVGPVGLRVRDLQQSVRDGVGVAILEQKIATSRGTYKDFSLEEIKQLKQMKIDDRLVAAMLKSTAENPKVAAPPPVAAAPVQRVALAAVAPAASSEDSMPAECLKLAAAVKVCDQAGGFFSMACKMGAQSQFNCPLPMSQILR